MQVNPGHPKRIPNLLLRQERTRRGWSQQQVADAVGTNTVMVSRWEGGVMRPGPHYRQLLCTLFGKNAEELGWVSLVPPAATLAVERTPEGVWHVPFRRNPCFTGREAILERLHAAFQSGGSPVLPQALTGLGGIGKTQTALEYAHRFRDNYLTILWVPAETRDLFLASFAALSQPLNLPEQHEPDQRSTLAAVQRWLQTHANWLLVLDNLEDLALLSEFVPTGPGNTVVTTRLQATGTVAERIELAPLSLAEGTLLLLRRAKRLPPDGALEQIPAPERQGAEAIATLLDGLPLALDQAGAYIEETGCSLEGYVVRCQTHLATLLGRRGRVSSDHPASVLLTFILALERVEQATPAVAEALRLCAFLHPEAIPEELFLSGRASSSSTELLALDDTLEALQRASLVRRDPATKMLSLHRLVQRVLHERLGYEAQRQWAERAIERINRVLPDVSPSTWFGFQRYLAQCFAGTTLISTWQLQTQAAARLLEQTGAYLRECARYREAEDLLRRAWVLQKRISGPAHPETARILSRLAQLSLSRGKYWRAQILARASLERLEHTLGAHHLDLVLPLSCLAQIQELGGHYREAEPLYHRALAIQEHTPGTSHPDLADTLNNLASLYWNWQRYAQAEPLLQRALAINEQAFGPEHPQVAATLNNLGLLYHDQRHFERAEPLLRRALDIQEQLLGPEHLDVAIGLNNVARLAQAQRNYQEAEMLFLRSLDIRERVLGPEHPMVARTFSNMAMLYRDQGRYGEARVLCRRAQTIYEHNGGPLQPRLATLLKNLALICQDQGDGGQAESLFQQSLTMHQQILGPSHPQTLQSRNGLARLYLEQGQDTQALGLCHEILGLAWPPSGLAPLQAAESLATLTCLARLRGDIEQAALLWQQARTTWTQVLGTATEQRIAQWEREEAQLVARRQARATPSKGPRLGEQAHSTVKHGLGVLLSPREQVVLGLLAEGMSNREIASELVVELSTIKWHLKHLYSKLQVHSRTQAVARARAWQVLKEAFGEP